MNNSNTPRILVVDDNPDIHADFRKILAPPTVVASELAAAASTLFNRAPAPSSKQWFDLATASIKLVRAQQAFLTRLPP